MDVQPYEYVEAEQDMNNNLCPVTWLMMNAWGLEQEEVLEPDKRLKFIHSFVGFLLFYLNLLLIWPENIFFNLV